jgi:hypothetical protein
VRLAIGRNVAPHPSPNRQSGHELGCVIHAPNSDAVAIDLPAASPSARMTASAATNLMITREPAFQGLSATLYSCNVVNIYSRKSGEGGQQNQSRKISDHFFAKVVRTLSAHLVSREVK